jgi:cytochrome c peroxidase
MEAFATLAEVLDHYSAAGRAHLNPQNDPRMQPLSLTSRNREDLLAFLRSPTDTELVHDPRFSNPW